MREARAQQEELDAEDQPEGAIAQVLCCDNLMTGKSVNIWNAAQINQPAPLRLLFSCWKLVDA